MKALKSIKLINFQSHRDTLINLAGLGYLTVITGPSDSGKTAIIRALRWVCYNVPQGDGFIFNAEDKCTVSLVYEDGTMVERIRSRGGINRYIVNGQTFEGFGTGVPLEVQKATGIRKLEIGDQSFLLNLSEQLDGPFLGKSVSGPARAKVLGKLAGTEEIDYAGKETGTDLYRSKRMQEVLDKGIEILKTDIEDFHWIYSQEARVISAEAFLADMRVKAAENEKLKTLRRQWETVGCRVIALTKVVVNLQEVDKGLELARTAQDGLAKGNALATLRGSHFEEVVESEHAKATLFRLDPVFKFVVPMVEEIVGKSAKAASYTTMHDSYNQLNLYVLSLRKLTQRLSGIEDVANHIQQAFSKSVQLSAIKDSHSRYEKSRLSVLSLSNVVEMFQALEETEAYLIQAFNINVWQIRVRELADSYERSNISFIFSDKTMARYSGIDEAGVHLLQASKNNAHAFDVKKSLGQRVSLVQEISQSLQLFGELTQEINVAESDYLEFMSTLGKCPTCGNDIDIQKLKEAI